MRVDQLLYLISRLGLRSLMGALIHRIKLSSGYYRWVTPVKQWHEFRAPLTEVRLWPGRVPHALRSDASLVERAERLLAGRLQYFGGQEYAFPTWNASPVSSVSVDKRHWSAFPDFDKERGDIKWFYEASRFDWLYTLGRAYAATGHHKYLDGAMGFLAGWMADNPPNGSIAWRCAQECSIRILALAWFREVLIPAGRHEDACLCEGMILAFAVRVEASLGYALAQHNNHALCESLALYVAGLLFSKHARSAGWRRRGRAEFVREAVSQFSSGGFYAMNSLPYMRVAMRWLAYFLVVESGRSLECDLTELKSKGLRAAGLLCSVMSFDSGEVPNYGANDGSNPCRLSSADWADYRPVVNSIVWLCSGKSKFPGNVHCDEEIWWYGGAADATNLNELELGGNSGAPGDGYYSLRVNDNWVAIRAQTLTARPGQADMLHADIWLHGRPIAIDSGSYSYCDAHNMGAALAGCSGHNAVIVDGLDQMERAGAFLWSDWTQSRVLQCEKVSFGGRTFFAWVGEHDGYLKRTGATHRRTVCVSDAAVLVFDECVVHKKSSHERPVHVNWKLSPSSDWDLIESSSSRAAGVINGQGTSIHLTGLTNECVISSKLPGTGFIDPEQVVSPTYGVLSSCVSLSAKSKGALRAMLSVDSRAVYCADETICWDGVRIKIDSNFHVSFFELQ